MGKPYHLPPLHKYVEASEEIKRLRREIVAEILCDLAENARRQKIMEASYPCSQESTAVHFVIREKQALST